MTPLEFAVLAFVISIAAGALGSLLGLGGGVIVIPALTLLFHIDIRYAIGASIVSVIATSSGAAASYVRDRLTNMRVAMVLELATTSGALTGAYLAGLLNARWLYIIFGVVLGYSSLVMIRKLRDPEFERVVAKPAPWADYLRLHGSYYDERLGREIVYRVVSTRIGLALMYVAGAISGLLGIGSGALKVPAMDLAMHMPIKVSTATSNFMIGVTAAAMRRSLFHARRNRSVYRGARGGRGVVGGGRRFAAAAQTAKLDGPDRVRSGFAACIGANAVEGNPRMMSQANKLPPYDAELDPRVRRVELLISNLLRGGVIASLSLIVLGTIITFVQHPAYFSQSAELERLTAPNSPFPHALHALAGGLRDLRGEAIVTLGLLVLIATPVVRVAVSIFAFIYQGDRVYTLITAGVLCLLLLSLVLGRIE